MKDARTVIGNHRSPFGEPLEHLHPFISGAFGALDELGQRKLRHPQLKGVLEGFLPAWPWTVNVGL